MRINKLYKFRDGRFVTTHYIDIDQVLDAIGVMYTRLECRKPSIADHMKNKYGTPYSKIIDFSNQDTRLLAHQFSYEHYHTEHDFRYIAAGSCAFYFNTNDTVYVLYCHECTILKIPANILHWFQYLNNQTKIIRFFENVVKYETYFTDSGIQDRYPKINELVTLE